MSAFDWSLKLFRVSGIEVRAHWTLFALLLSDMAQYPHAGTAMWLFMTVALFASVLLHEFGHALAARAVGGDCRKIELWMLGGLAHCEVPMRPWPQFATSAAGPLINGILASGAYGALAVSEAGGYLFDQPWLVNGLAYVAWINLRQLVFNLLPVHPLDGAGLFRALLWPVIGLRRATIVTLFLGYPAVIGILLWSISVKDMVFTVLGVWMLLRIVQEHTLLKLGQLDEETWRGGGAAARGEGWWARWRRQRAVRAQERRERAEQEEQDLIDRLLAKVGETGLASLSKQERATLEAYSRKQREKMEIGGR
jgi:Zn-dependent protease